MGSDTCSKALLVSAVFLAVLVTAPLVTPGWAQSPARTGAGGDPRATVTAPNTSRVGRTKPPGRAAGAEVPLPSPDRAEAPDKAPHKTRNRTGSEIGRGICVGCE